MFNMYRMFNIRGWEQIMEKKLGVTEARRRLASIIDEVRLRGDNYIIVKHGKPAAAVVPIAVYRKWQKDRQELFQVIRGVQEGNPRADPDKVMGEVLEAQQAVRQANPDRD